ncbi:TonB-dependent receptor plug domain-containing protein [Hymenobacter negativus]|uniref:TonB-dependent receptor plug domain-containing protein n=1 Tax=Hymenobacter negativus TaxID=2795026 RepID=A0ABS3QGU2_9BACT|nr:TonB-dependent receptor plug domain-containing protein [Hymenobacter negativus]MBO2010455.1 TonB-dependent receptor plug domain-containing protein [Hymenobacter negativus]
MTLFTALTFLMSTGGTSPARAQLLPPAAPPLIVVEAPAHLGDTIHLSGVCVVGSGTNDRETTKCCSCNNPVNIINIPWSPPAFLTIQTLLPQVPGVQVTPNSGAPGDWATVRIRGGSSLAGPDQPLYVVDGTPALNADFQPGTFIQAAFSLGSAPEASLTGANPLLALPMEDVERITVISGGVAAAQYGAQGSNGVIEITTKRGGKLGQKQPLRVRYAAFGGVQQVRQRYDLLNARQYADLANEASFGINYYPLSGPVTPDTDWQAELFQPAVLHNHHLALDGSSARTRYAVSADYLNQQGVVLNSGLDRYLLRFNLDQQIGQRLRLSLSTSASAISQDLPVAGTVAQALLAPPTVAVRDAQGNFQRYDFGNSSRNPVDWATTDGTRATTRRLLLQTGAEYTLHPSLILSGQVSREEGRVNSNTHFLVNTGQQAMPTSTTTRTLSINTTATIAQLRLAYDHTFGDAHRVDLTATAGYQHYLRGTANSSYDYPYASAFSTDATTSFSSAGLLASYAYRARYELLASLRRDANRGAPGYFSAEIPTVWLPGAEVRWQLHQESFMADAAVLTKATLWASAGQTSTTSLPATGWGSGVGSGNILLNINQTVTTLASSGPVPPAPRTTQLEAGLNLGFWQDRLRVDVTAFRRNTAHLTVPQVLVRGTVAGISLQNEPREATLRNQGLLLGISTYWQRGRLSGSARLAATWQQQRIQAVTALAGAGDVPGLVVGEAPHPFFLYQRLPVSETGVLRYQDLNNSNGYITDADARYQGTALPTQLYTLTQTLSWGRLSFDAQLDAMAGQQLLNTTLATLDLPSGRTNGTTRLLDRWTPTHYSPDIPRAGSSLNASGLSNQRYDDAQLQSATYLRLSQLSVSYALRPATAMRPISVWVGAQNLFVLTSYRGFDPNVSSGGATLLAAGYDTNYFPVPRTWLLGVRATL